MTGSLIYQLVAIWLSLLSYKRGSLSRFIQFLLLLSIVSFILLLEFYYQYGQCAVSQEYSKENIKLTHRIIDMLDNLSLSYWPDCQSLLNVLRNETYNVWDHDVDLSIEWPSEPNHHDPKLSSIELLIKKIEKYGFKVDFYSNRKLLSLKIRNDTLIHRSHVDIWLWTRKSRHTHYENENDQQKLVLEISDYTFKYKSRLISHIYPLKHFRWLTRNITIPFDSHTIAYKEFGASYMKATVFRKNCIHNLFNGRWM